MHRLRILFLRFYPPPDSFLSILLFRLGPLGRCSCCPLSRPFVCECHNISTVPRFQPPPRRTQRADFPHCALLFASPQGLWDLSCWGDFRHRPPHLVAVVQPQRFVQPLRTPPLPAEALTVPGPRHMAPDLLFHPVQVSSMVLDRMDHGPIRFRSLIRRPKAASGTPLLYT